LIASDLAIIFLMIEKLSHKIKQLLSLSSRKDIFRILPKNSICAELGVFKGDFSKQILKYTYPKEVHFIDIWWKEFGEYYPDWGEYTNYGKLKTQDAYNDTLKKINNYTNSFIYVGNDVEYLKTFSDRYFDWVYIYSSHEYDHTKDELEVLNNKIKENGIICGHDWHNDETHIHYGVTKAVVKFCDSYNWKLIYVNKHMQWR